jgi:hypothetical protein
MIQDIMHDKAQLLDYDAICTFVFPDYLALARFMDESQMRMMVGDEYMLIENGKSLVS